jgi:hypothetical protein
MSYKLTLEVYLPAKPTLAGAMAIGFVAAGGIGCAFDSGEFESHGLGDSIFKLAVIHDDKRILVD